MIEREWAERFAAEWVEAWNSHNMDRVMTHYAEEFEMSSPLIVQLMNEPSGARKGKAAVRAYWEHAMGRNPGLHFRLIQVLVGVDSVTLYYVNQAGRHTAEVLVFDECREVVKGMAHYSE